MKRPVIHNWAIGRMFGQPVVRGEVDGRMVTIPLQYIFGYPDIDGLEVDLRFYCNDGTSKAVTHKFRAGCPATDPWGS